MKKYFYLFLISLVLIVTSIAYMGNYRQSTGYENYKLEFFASSELKSSVNTNFNYLISYPHLLDCTVNYSSRIEYRQEYKGYNYSQAASNSTHLLRIVRALTVYYPIEKNDNFQSEFSWMYRSWIEMQKYEPNKWRTDIVVFIDTEHEAFQNKDFFLKQLNCSILNVRKSKKDKPMCTLVKYTPYKSRLIRKLSSEFINGHKESKHNYILKDVDIFSDDEMNLRPFFAYLKKITNYGYLDSILMAFDGWSFFKSAGYDFLIRSDMDVFLTPLFGMWLPRRCNEFYVGRGGYSANFNMKRLKRIAANIGFEYVSETNLGSTWYSTPDQFRMVSYLTLFSMAYLSEEEFSKPEREGKLGVRFLFVFN